MSAARYRASSRRALGAKLLSFGCERSRDMACLRIEEAQCKMRSAKLWPGQDYIVPWNMVQASTMQDTRTTGPNRRIEVDNSFDAVAEFGVLGMSLCSRQQPRHALAKSFVSY